MNKLLTVLALSGITLFPLNASLDKGIALKANEASAMEVPIVPGISTSIDSIGDPKIFDEGTSVTFVGKFQDDSAPFAYGTVWVVEIKPGDGSVITLDKLEVPYTEFKVPHTYGYVSADKAYTPSVIVTRYEGGSNASEKAVTNLTIKNVVPAVSVTPASSTINEGTTLNLTATASGGNAPLTYSWSGGCVGTSNVTTAPKSVGTYTCVVTVIDSDGDVATGSANVVVNKVVVTPPAPVNGGTTPPAPVNDKPAETVTEEVLGTKDDNSDEKDSTVTKTNKKVLKEEEKDINWMLIIPAIVALLAGMGTVIFFIVKKKKSSDK